MPCVEACVLRRRSKCSAPGSWLRRGTTVFGHWTALRGAAERKSGAFAARRCVARCAPYPRPAPGSAGTDGTGRSAFCSATVTEKEPREEAGDDGAAETIVPVVAACPPTSSTGKEISSCSNASVVLDQRALSAARLCIPESAVALSKSTLPMSARGKTWHSLSVATPVSGQSAGASTIHSAVETSVTDALRFFVYRAAVVRLWIRIVTTYPGEQHRKDYARYTSGGSYANLSIQHPPRIEHQA